jgi:hypothetical protein
MAFAAWTGEAISCRALTTHPVVGDEPVIVIDRFGANNYANTRSLRGKSTQKGIRIATI